MAIRRSKKTKKSRNHRRNQRVRAHRRTARGLRIEALEDRRLLALGPQLIGVLPNAGTLLEDGDIRSVAPQELTFRFDEDQTLDTSTLDSAFQITRSGLDGVFGDPIDGVGDDVVVTPGWIGLGEQGSEVIVRFAERLVDDNYRVIVFGTGDNALRNADGLALNDLTDDGVDNGADESLDFELDLGAQIVAVVPQPVSRDTDGSLVQTRDQIVIYFNDDELFVEDDEAGNPTAQSAENPAFYQLMLTQDTVTNTDDVVFTPTTVDYDAATNRAVLTFAQNLDELAGPGTFRLRVGTDEAVPPVPVTIPLSSDPGSSFANATDISTDFDTTDASSIMISEEIVSDFFPLDYPGALDEPGMRSIPVQGPYLPNPDVLSDTIYDTAAIARDSLTGGITQAFYNFRDFYGFDPEGNPLNNQITSNQRQRTREIFEQYGDLLGIDFVETADLGMTIVTGDLRALSPNVPTGPGGVLGLAAGGLTGLAIMDAAEDWTDRFGGNWYQTAMHEIGHLLGLGHTDELPPITIMNDEPILAFDNPLEPDFPGDHDIVHGQHRFRPENNDVDLYRFELQATGLFTAETFAERLPSSSLLDTTLTVWRDTLDGPELLSRNDNYFSQDSLIKLNLTAGTYYIGVSASGNDDYDPVIEDSGIGGTSEGRYDLRLNFRPGATRSITDIDNPNRGGTALDGDLDGVAGGTYNFWFRTAAPQGLQEPGEPRTLFVDKGQLNGDGSLEAPFGNLPAAMDVAQPGDIVRVVANGGTDGDVSTLGDNLAYEIGFGNLQETDNSLSDGPELVVPSRVTLMVDEGAIFKLKDSRIGVGSSTLSKDLSAGAIQILGTPDQDVIFTSFQDQETGVDTGPLETVPAAGDWGGISIRNDLDRSESRFLWEDQGIFLNYINHADFRYGGGNVPVNGVQEIVNPISLNEARPTISFNSITLSADAAIAADPNSFRETNFHSPAFQLNDAFTSDYARVGPDIDLNTITDNSTNGLFVRVTTAAGTEIKPQTVAGRWDDTGIVHVLGQTLKISGTPGGPVLQQDLPPSDLVTLTAQTDGSLEAGLYNYRLVFLDADGNESLPSLPTETAVVEDDGSVLLRQLPPAPEGFSARRLYRSEPSGNPNGEYRLVTQLNRSDSTFTDDGSSTGGLLDLSTATQGLLRARLNASLTVDPGMIVKLEGARIELGLGAQLLAEGVSGQNVVFTSKADDRYGVSGSFDTNNDQDQNAPQPGDWAGIYVGQTANASLDHSLLLFGGGQAPVEGSFTGFNVLEAHQGTLRLTNSILEDNAGGLGGDAPSHRFGRGFNDDATVFIRSAQPIIVDNIFRNNEGSTINANANALNHHLVKDIGRSTGTIDLATDVEDNQGPLIKLNRLEDNGINGLEVRGETLTTQGVWDDTDIAHVVLDTIYVPDHHVYGGLRLESRPNESLVVKLEGSTAGFTATGRPLDIDDRIGGALHIIGQPGSPVVLTSLRDDTQGAGFRPSDGLPQTDTNNDGNATAPSPGDWRSIRLDQYSHDRNINTYLENESAGAAAPGTNATTSTAESLGSLASSEKESDENLRLGFEIHGLINAPNDVDVYSFQAAAGTEIWLDIDRTRHALDTVVELIGSDGRLVARSDNSLAETNRGESIVTGNPLVDANVLQKSPYLQDKDAFSTNPLDAGLRVVLPGAVGSDPTTYYVRVRSSSPDLDNLQGGLTTGRYELQVRLQETNEVPGSAIRYADVRYATRGIEVLGQVIHSPLLGEAVEGNNAANNAAGGAEALGNLLNTDRATLSIGGRLDSDTDVDFYRFEIEYDSIQSISGYDTASYLSTVFDLDYSDQLGRSDASMYVFDQDLNLVLSSDSVRGNANSNIAEDQPAPLNGADMDDLSRGSAGTQDPFIGAQSLPQGTYYLAITNSSRMPSEFEQFTQEDPSNPLIRLEPINSVTRIAEDRIDRSGGSNIAVGPQVPILLDPTESVVPFTLSDVTLFVSQDQGLSAGYVSNIQTVDPFTGIVETQLGNVFGEDGAPFLGDIAMRYDGELFTLSQSYRFVAGTDDTVGNVLQIDTGTAEYTNIGDDGIETWRPAPDTGDEERVPNPNEGRPGIFFEAMTFAGNGQFDLYAVGDRGDAGTNTVAREENILYRFTTSDGTATSSPFSDRTGCPPGGNSCRFVGAGTQIRERGQIITSGSELIAVDATDPTAPFDPLLSIQDGTTFTISDGSITKVFEFDTGPEVLVQIDQDAGQVIRDSDFMILDGDFFQFDTGSTLVVPADIENPDETVTPAGATIPDGLLISLTANDGGSVVLEFEDTGIDVPDGQDTIPYDASMDQQALRTSIVDTVNGIPNFPISATSIGSDLISFQGERQISLSRPLTIDVTDTVLTTLVQPTAAGAPVMEDTILLPNSGYNDGETFTIGDGNVSLLFEFVTDGGAPTDPAAIPIRFDNAADDFSVVGNQIIAALQANDVRLQSRLELFDPGVAPDASDQVGALHLETSLKLSGELGDSPIFEVLSGSRFSDGETFDIVTLDGTVTFEVERGGGVTAGNVPVSISAGDAPTVIASRMADAINAYTSAEANAVDQYVVVNGQQRPLGRTDATPHLMFTENSNAMSLVSLFDYDPNPDPPSFFDIEGILNGFEETQSVTEFQDQLAQELNVRRTITDATNDPFQPIEITTEEDHGLVTGQSVIIRGISGDIANDFPGQSYANGLFDIVVTGADSFELVGTENRNQFDGRFDYVAGGYFINYEASSEGERTNFLGGKGLNLNAFDTVNFDDISIFVDQGTEGGVAGDVRVPLRASDSAFDVAAIMEELINREFHPAATATQRFFQSTVSIINGSVLDADSPLQFINNGTGGSITGIAVVSGRMFAVDDMGGLYEIQNYQGSLSTNFIADIGGIEFSGLTVGPQQVQDGIYSELLFGISRGGELYAFDTTGELQPIFVSGQTSLDTGITNANGLDFSNLDVNLWHVSGNRSDDAGHGIDVPVDDSRLNGNGGDSFYFGFQDPGANGWSSLDPTNRNNYDFPGGAHGSLESNTFSLEGYSPNDDPVLYFNYFLETEGAIFTPGGDPMRDSFRVYVAGENSEWQLLATNDSFRSNGILDEFELGEGAVPQTDEVNGRRGVQELYDNTGTWRQARISLAPWAGQENLKLRFDFSTAASMDVGATGGIDLRAVLGSKIPDAATLLIDDAVTFEFDQGHILVAPSAAVIPDESQLTIDDITYEFDFGDGEITGDVMVSLDPTDSSLVVAEKLEAAIAGAATIYRDDNRLNLPLAADVDVLDSELIHEAQPGVADGNVSIPVHLGMSETEVAEAVRKSLEDELAGGDFGVGEDGYQNIHTFREVVRLVGHTVSDPGPLGMSDSLLGDSFGSFNVSGNSTIGGRAEGALRGMDNAHEGVYIDDLIIGFAERGELITNAAGNASFTDNPQVPSAPILQGSYQVEIRRGPEYGLASAGSPAFCTLPGPPPFGCGGRAFDTNDRLTHAVSLVTTSADQLVDGQTFQISDGIDTVVFEYEDLDIGDGVTSGHIAIPFDASRLDPQTGVYKPDTDYEMARRIRDAINSSDVQAVVNLTAALSDGEQAEPTINPPPRPGSTVSLLPSESTSNVINLFGNATGDVFPTFDFGAIDVITYGYSQPMLADAPSTEHRMVGDSNTFRDQGQILIHSNVVRDSAEFGIVADAGSRNRSDLVPLAGTLPHPGPVRNLRVRNSERLVPGVVINNNLITGNQAGGILFSGDANTGNGLASVPYGRIVNNTIYGTGSGDGIRVTQNASPTVLNTIFANLQTGLNVDATSQTTELGGLLFQDVANPTTTASVGAFPILLDSDEPLFVDAANNNFYLAEGSRAIDSSVDSLEDRQELVFVKEPLGIANSPILAPDRDVFGQLREDDPTVDTPTGQGANVFKDRGAVDRVDFSGPFAILQNPADNDAAGVDTNPRITYVNVTTTVSDFSIQIFDGSVTGGSDGTGADDNTVLPETVTLSRDGQTLVQGVDYSFAYDSTSNTIRLTPVAGIWRENRLFEIDLANEPRTVATFRSSTPADEEQFTVTDLEDPANSVEFEFDTGYTLIVPPGGGADLTDGETFRISQGTEMETFEFDDDGEVTEGRTAVPFTSSSLSRQVANAIVAAIRTTTLPLTPTVVGQDRVHLGGDIATSLDTSDSALNETGQPGVTNPDATAIRVVPRDGAQVAEAVAEAIQQSELVGVSVEVFGSDVFLTGMASVVGLPTTDVSEIRDVAGNPLRPNRADSTTRFTIMTGLGIDYGDAPATFPVLRADNGAGHAIVEDFYLGNLVSAEPDGRPSAGADADIGDDGVIGLADPLPSGKPVNIEVIASADGFLDAWLDKNGDGDWDDASEQIFTSEPLVAGSNALSFVLSTESPGDTYVRFRFSSMGDLGPEGMADDGEVEDYLVTVLPNPWNNPDNSYDVNADGLVSPWDALQIINRLHFEGVGELPTPPTADFQPPPFYDVDNNGLISPTDALLVINRLNTMANSGQQAEGEAGNIRLAASSTVDTAVVDSGLESGLMGGELLVTPELVTNSADTDTTDRSTMAADLSPAATQPVVAAEKPSTFDARSELTTRGDHGEDLEDLLEEIAGEIDEAQEDEDARDAFFSILGS